MSKSSVFKNNIQDHLSLNPHLRSRRQSSRRDCPLRRQISKRNDFKKHQSKPFIKKFAAKKLSHNQDCHSIMIEETTQQGPNSSGLTQQSKESDCKDYSSEQLGCLDNDRNSNLICQRISQFTEYLPQIQSYILEKEAKYIPKLIIDSGSISQMSRTKLITWVFDLSSRFQFKIETSFCATNIIDRALGLFKISMDRLPLLGITALFMATKYEQILIPNLSNFRDMVPQIYKVTNESILKLEGILLNILNFDLGYISPILFINYSHLTLNFSQAVLTRSVSIAKQMLFSSSCRYWPSSRIASHAISTAQSDCVTLRPGSIQKSTFKSLLKVGGSSIN